MTSGIARRVQGIALAAACAWGLAAAAQASPVPQRDAEPLRHALAEGDAFHVAAPGGGGTFAFVGEAWSDPVPARLPGLLARAPEVRSEAERASGVVARQADLTAPALAAALGSVGWAASRRIRRSA